MIEEFIKSFISLFVMMNPFSSITIFYALTDHLHKKKFKKSADEAILTAGIVLFVFLLGGQYILKLFGISIESFKIAGGIIILIIGVKNALNIKISQTHKKYTSLSAVPIGTPLTTGPGTIATSMLLVTEYGFLYPSIAALACLLITWIGFRYSDMITKFLGHQGSDVFSRIMGLLIAAVAVEFIKSGIMG